MFCLQFREHPTYRHRRIVLHLLFPFRNSGYPESAASADSTLNSPVSPVAGEGSFPFTAAVRTLIYINIMPYGSGSPSQMSSTNSHSSCSDTGDVFRSSDHPRQLVSINPIVSFTSPSPIVAYSHFTVCSEDLILHAETVPLVLLEYEEPLVLGFLYSTQLVPNYWKVILDSPGTYILRAEHSQTHLRIYRRPHTVHDIPGGC